MVGLTVVHDDLEKGNVIDLRLTKVFLYLFGRVDRPVAYGTPLAVSCLPAHDGKFYLAQVQLGSREGKRLIGVLGNEGSLILRDDNKQTWFTVIAFDGVRNT